MESQLLAPLTTCKHPCFPCFQNEQDHAKTEKTTVLRHDGDVQDYAGGCAEPQTSRRVRVTMPR